uniref:Uncharacterized protein n=1 Tax=Arundo donax TaxID=35708 RepID=A0A0A9EFD9_ARUDO
MNYTMKLIEPAECCNQQFLVLTRNICSRGHPWPTY